MNLKAREKKLKSAADLKQGEKGMIRKLIKSAWTLPLLEKGCLPGSEVSLRYKAPFGGILCLEIDGCHLSLRTEEAQTLALE